jgi:hypothetical protein
MIPSSNCRQPCPIIIRWGDTRTLIATFTLSGAIVDLTGATVVLTVACQPLGIREQFTSAGVDAPVVLDLVAGTATCTVASAGWPNCGAIYCYAWQLTDDDDNISTTQEEPFEVLPAL